MESGYSDYNGYVTKARNTIESEPGYYSNYTGLVKTLGL